MTMAGRSPRENDEKLEVDLASPPHFKTQPVSDKTHDGDWVIWSTVSRDEQRTTSE